MIDRPDAFSQSYQGNQPDPLFRQQVVKMLLAHKVNYLSLPPGALDAYVQQLWDSPTVQLAWNDPSLAASDGLPNIETWLNTALFSAQPADADLSAATESVVSQGGGEIPASMRAGQAGTEVQVPYPFDPQFAYVSGNDYGQAVDPNSPSGGYGATHLGVDYGTPAGTALASPFAGTIEVQEGIPDYGNLVLIHLDTGYTLAYGHVNNATVVSGQRVNPGDVVAISGQNIGDSQGAVTLVEWRDPNGNLLNPHDVLDPIFKGTTFKNLGMGASVVGAYSASQANYARYGIFDTTAESVYSPVVSAWERYFGRRPTTAQLLNVVAHGSDPASWEDYMRSLPGHIPGMTAGQSYDLRKLVDNTSTSLLGHLGTDGIVKELFDAGLTTPKAVRVWYDEHSPRQLDAATYNAIYAANTPILRARYNEAGFDPRWASAQAGSVAQAPTATQQNLDAETIWQEGDPEAFGTDYATQQGIWNDARDTPPPPQPVADVERAGTPA